jgi:GNAT superfamily N-acetyltransferase
MTDASQPVIEPDLQIIEVGPSADDGRLEQAVEAAMVSGRAAFGDRHTMYSAAELRAKHRELTTSDMRVLVALVDGAPVGEAMLDLPLRDNPHFATAALSVVPPHRRRGVGSRLLAEVERLARAAGRTTICVESTAPSGRPDPAVGFAGAHGYSAALADLRSDLDLPAGSLDPVLAGLEAEAAGHSAGYQLLTWWDDIPARWLDQRATLAGRMSTDAPMGEVDLQPEVWDADRVRESFRVAKAQGRRVVETAALHVGSGQLVAVTMMAAPEHTPEMAYQWDTLVLKEHRGRRLGQLVKAANLRALRAELPAVRRIVTWNAEVNEPMIRVNRAFGFVRVGTMTEWQKTLNSRPVGAR